MNDYLWAIGLEGFFPLFFSTFLNLLQSANYCVIRKKYKWFLKTSLGKRLGWRHRSDLRCSSPAFTDNLGGRERGHRMHGWVSPSATTLRMSPESSNYCLAFAKVQSIFPGDCYLLSQAKCAVRSLSHVQLFATPLDYSMVDSMTPCRWPFHPSLKFPGSLPLPPWKSFSRKISLPATGKPVEC